MRRTRTLASLSLPLMAISACSYLPVQADLSAVGQKEIDAEIALIDLPAAYIADAEIDASTVASWTELTSDPVLIAFIEEGLANNPGLRSTSDAIARAEAQLRQAEALRSPFLNFSVSGGARSPLEDVGIDDTGSASLSAGWEADVWGRLAAGIRAADLDVIGSKAFYESSRQALAASIARAYVRAIAADLQVALTEETVAALAETRRIVNVRYEAGFARLGELTLADTDLASARDALVQLEADARAARRTLQVLLGRYPDGNIRLPAELPSSFRVVAAGAPMEILRRRPDIFVAEYAVRANFADVAALEAGRWPELTVSGAFSTSGGLDNMFDPAQMALSLGVNLANSLFDGGLTRARIDAATATARASVADYGSVVLTALSEVEQRLDDVSTLAERRIRTSESAEASRETLRLAEIRYGEGDIDLLDVLTFRQRALNADRNLVQIDRLAIEARINLFQALGGGAP